MSHWAPVIGIHSEIHPEAQALVTFTLANSLISKCDLKVLIFDFAPGRFIETCQKNSKHKESKHLQIVSLVNLSHNHYNKTVAKELNAGYLDDNGAKVLRRLPTLLQKTVSHCRPHLVLVNFMPGFHQSQSIMFPIADAYILVNQPMPPILQTPQALIDAHHANVSSVLNLGLLVCINALPDVSESGDSETFQFPVRELDPPICVIDFSIWTSELQANTKDRLFVFVDSTGLHGLENCDLFIEDIRQKFNF